METSTNEFTVLTMLHCQIPELIKLNKGLFNTKHCGLFIILDISETDIYLIKPYEPHVVVKISIPIFNSYTFEILTVKLSNN